MSSSKIIVTGGFGFIGSNLIKALNAKGETDIIVVDNLCSNPDKYKNLLGCRFLDFISKDKYLFKIHQFNDIKVIFHLGACSNTMVSDGNYVLENNFEYTKSLFNYSQQKEIPFIYASSAAVYGCTDNFKENQDNLYPLNIYGYSKLLFDNYARYRTNDFKLPFKRNVVGLRFFNVYGPNEDHKGNMASIVHKIITGKTDKVFYGNHSRDFVYVDDVIKVILHFYENHFYNGIFNVGTGEDRAFEDIFKIVGKPVIHEIMPPELATHYQSHTKSDTHNLSAYGGYHEKFLTLEQGIERYLQVTK